MPGAGSELMKNHRNLLISIGIVAILFVAAIIYTLVSNQDPYKFHSGMGSGLSVSPDDEMIVFSYYEHGAEAIFKGRLSDGKVEKVTEPVDEDHRMPQFSPNGEDILYLSAGNEGVQSLQYMSIESGSEPLQLTGMDVHVSTAAFSPDGKTIYYVATPAEDFLKPEGEKENGADLFSVNTAYGEFLKLTDKDAFDMSKLSVSADGTTLYYTEFDGIQQLIAYPIDKKVESPYLPQYLKEDLYEPYFSEDQEILAYTAASEESKKSGSLFEYELFLMETSSGEKRRLTDFHASVTSPSFFHHENRIAFLMQPNWPDQLEVYEAMTVDFDSGEIAPLTLEFPESNNTFQPAAIARLFVNPLTVPGLYILLFGLLSVYFHSALDKRYLPTKISAVLTAIVFIVSCLILFMNPWAAIGLFGLAAVLAFCTVLVLAFAYIYTGLTSSEDGDNEDEESEILKR